MNTLQESEYSKNKSETINELFPDYQLESTVKLSNFEYDDIFNQYEQYEQLNHKYQHNQITMFIDGSSLAYLHSVNENYKQSIINHLYKLMRQYNTTQAIIFTEDSSKNFRKTLFPEYKAQRAENKLKQLEQNKDYTPYLHQAKQFINQLKPFHAINVENDDIIRIVANQYRKPSVNKEYIIIANDSDLLAIYGNHLNMKSNNEFVIDKDSIELKETVKIDSLTHKETKTKKLYTTGIFNTYSKILKGASKENYKGLKGYGDVKVYELLKDCKNEQDLQQVCIEHFKLAYSDEYINQLKIAFQLCYLIEYNNTLTIPTANNLKDIIENVINE